MTVCVSISIHDHAPRFLARSQFSYRSPKEGGAGFAQKKKKKTTPPLLDRYMLKQARMGVCVKEGGPYCVCRLVTSFFRAADVLLLLLLIYLIGPRAERLRK